MPTVDVYIRATRDFDPVPELEGGDNVGYAQFLADELVYKIRSRLEWGANVSKVLLDDDEIR